MELRKISLKYEARCINCGRKIPAGEMAYWEADKGVWHLDCEGRGVGHAQGKIAYQITSPRNFYVFLGGIAILAFTLGVLYLLGWLRPPAEPIAVAKRTYPKGGQVIQTVGEDIEERDSTVEHRPTWRFYPEWIK